MSPADLRRIVGSVVDKETFRSLLMAELPHDLRAAGYKDRLVDFVVTLANHADTLVALVEACETLAAYELQGMLGIGSGARGAVLAMRNALARVEAVK